MAFSLSPNVDVFEKNASFRVANLPSTKTGTVVKADSGQAFKIIPITNDVELVDTFAKPTSFNFKDWYNAWNFLQYASTLFVVRPIDAAGITKNAAIALNGGDGDIALPLVLQTFQGIEQSDLYNEDNATSTLDGLTVDSHSKRLATYTEVTGDWTFTEISKLRRQQLVQKGTTGVNSGILQIGSQDTIQISGATPTFDTDLLDVTNLDGWDLEATIALGVAEGSSFAVGENVTATDTTVRYTGVVVSTTANDIVINLIRPGVAVITGTETITGDISGAGVATAVPRCTPNGLVSDLTTLSGNVEAIRLVFYNKYVVPEQNIGVAICSNDESWIEDVSTNIAKKFNSFFEFRPVFDDGIINGKREFAVIVFRAEDDGSFTDVEKFVVSYEENGRDEFNKNIFVEEVFKNESSFLYCKLSTATSGSGLAVNVNTGGNVLPELHQSTWETIYPRFGTDPADKTFPAASASADGAHDPNGYAQPDIEDRKSVV